MKAELLEQVLIGRYSELNHNFKNPKEMLTHEIVTVLSSFPNSSLYKIEKAGGTILPMDVIKNSLTVLAKLSKSVEPSVKITYDSCLTEMLEAYAQLSLYIKENTNG